MTRHAQRVHDACVLPHYHNTVLQKSNWVFTLDEQRRADTSLHDVGSRAACTVRTDCSGGLLTACSFQSAAVTYLVNSRHSATL